MKGLCIVLFCVLCNVGFAQPGKVPVETVDGQKYHIHTVKPGNTVWWIHETYNVPVSEIVTANPGSEKGVSVGQKIRVPVPRKHLDYIVQPKETLFSIAKKFEVPLDSLIKSNPGTENGIQVGQLLKINNVYESSAYPSVNPSGYIANAKPAQDNPSDAPKITQGKSSGVKSSEVNSTASKSTEVKSLEVNSTAPKSTVVKSPEVTSTAPKSTVVKSPEVNSTASKSTEVKSLEVNSTAPKSTEVKSPEANFSEPKSAETKLTEIKPTSVNPPIVDAGSVKSNPVKIPVSDTVIVHIVKDNETLYTLSKRYMVKVEDLQNLNQLKTYRIKAGDKIKVQIKKELRKSVPIREVEPPSAQRVDSTILFPKKSQYKMAIFLPFNLDKQEANGEHIADLAAEFYMGAKLALDSLKRIGLNADVYVYDVKNDSNQTKKLLSKNELKDVDLIFGPLFPENAEMVARWSKKNKSRMICPATVQASIIRGNPFVYTAVPTDVQLQEGLATHIAKQFQEHQVVLLRPVGEKELLLFDAFRNTFLAQTQHAKLIEASLENYTTFLKRDIPSVLIFPTNDKALVIKFMNSMNSNASKLNADLITVCGTKDWLAIDEMRASFRNKFHFHYAAPNDLNYADEKTKHVLKLYRKTYQSDLTKMAAQGFDVIFHFCSELLLGIPQDKLIMNDFVFKQKGVSNGFQNSKCFILKQENFELINADH